MTNETYTPESYLTEKDLAKRWNLSTKTLQRWRIRHKGPTYLKLGGGVRYKPDNIREFEEERGRLKKSIDQFSCNQALSII